MAILPASGDGSRCRVEARYDPGTIFGVSTTATITFFDGLQAFQDIGWEFGGVDQQLDRDAIAARCNITINSFSFAIDDVALPVDASNLSVTMTYTGQDARDYEVNASLTGLTDTSVRATALQVFEGPPLPRAVVLSGASEVPNGANLGQGSLQPGETRTVQFGIQNSGRQALDISNLVISPPDNVIINSFTLGTLAAPAASLQLEEGEVGVLAEIRYTADANGPYNFRVDFETNDPDRRLVNFTVSGVTEDTVGPVLSVQTPVPTPTRLSDPRPFVFNSTEAGTVTSNCSLPAGFDSVSQGSNTVEFDVPFNPSPPPVREFSCTLEVRDAAGNLSNTLTVPTFAIDEQRPTVQVLGVPAAIGGEFFATIVFSEPVTGLLESEVTVTGGTISSFSSISGDTWQVGITPTPTDGASTVSLSIPSGVAEDLVGLTNTASATASGTFNPSEFQVTLSGLPAEVSGPQTITIAFSLGIRRGVTFPPQPRDFDVTGATVGSLGRFPTSFTLGGAVTYEFILTPDGSPNISLSLPAGVLNNINDIPYAASNVLTATFVDPPPSIEIGALVGPTGGTYTAAITLSEESTDFELGDLTLGNATATLTGSGTSYTATLTPDGDGEVTLSVAADVFTDAAGNPNTASNEVSTTFDGTGPDIEIAALVGPTGGTYTAAITLSEDSTNFDLADLTLGNATATLAGSGSSYTATLTPIGDGEVTLSVAADVFTDAAGNPNTASNVVRATFDSTPPDVTVTTSTDRFSGTTPFTVTVVFTEPVIGFEMGDLSVANGDPSAFSGDGTTFTATITPTGSGDVTILVPASVAADAAGNMNRASAPVTVSGQNVEITQELIAGFMMSRATALLAHQPELSGLFGTQPGSFDASVTRGIGTFDLVTRTGGPIWARLTGSVARSGASESTYLFGVLGTHITVNDNLLIGGMVQLDHAEETTGASSVSGTGWLAGPYIVTRSATQPLVFEASLLYGRSYNDISPFGTYTDAFETERVLATARLSGNIQGNGVVWHPSLGLSYVRDTQEAYVDSLSNLIGEQTIEMTEASFGLDFVRTLSDALTLTGGLAGIYSQSDGTGGQAAVLVPETEGLRARIDLGMNYASDSGLTSSVNLFYDGIGASGYESFGVDLMVTFRF